jgi:Domain of unknown function (DUF4340)
MNETLRTLSYVSVAIVVLLISWVTRPTPSVSVASSDTKVELSDLDDVSSAQTFEITQYDETEAKLSSFSVAKERGRWVIPSHHNYPADAEEQLKKISSLFVDLKAIQKITEDQTTFKNYGVVEPTAELKAGSEGVGQLVTIKNKQGDELVKLIVGYSAVSDTQAETDLHFVRKSNQNAVYVAKISTNSLATKFEDWIERDLLQLNAFDVSQLTLRDYSIVIGQRGGELVANMIQRMETNVTVNKDNSGWDLANMLVYENGKPAPSQLTEEEELNKAKLDGIKSALDDLKIVNVEPKPAVLVKALQDDKLASNPAAQRELLEKGFFVTRNEQKVPELFGTNGGSRIAQKDGVEYVLTFGMPESAQADDATKLNRYLMVNARVNTSLIPQAELEPEVAGPDSETKTTDEKSGKSDEKEKAADTKSDKEAAEKSEEALREEELKKKESERIKRDNQRKLDEYHDKIKKAERRVAELNARFEDWFYVVSDDVYKKVQLSRSDIVKETATAKAGGFGIDAFRALQKGGIQGSDAPPPGTPNPPPFPGAAGLQ